MSTTIKTRKPEIDSFTTSNVKELARKARKTMYADFTFHDKSMSIEHDKSGPYKGYAIILKFDEKFTRDRRKTMAHSLSTVTDLRNKLQDLENAGLADAPIDIGDYSEVDCEPTKGINLEGRTIIVSRAYWTGDLEERTVKATGGFGCSPGARGKAVFWEALDAPPREEREVNFFTGDEYSGRIDRYMVEAVIAED